MLWRNKPHERHGSVIILTPNTASEPLHERQKRAIALVEKIDPETFPDEPFVQRGRMFLLAREIWKLGGDVEDYAIAIRVLSERLSREELSEDLLFEYLVNGFENMRVPIDTEGFIDATYRKALAEPVPLPPSFTFAKTKLRQKLWSLVKHISAHHDSFELSQRLVSKCMGIDQHTVSDIIDSFVESNMMHPLDKHGNVVNRKEHPDKEYWVPGERCKRYSLFLPMP